MLFLVPTPDFTEEKVLDACRVDRIEAGAGSFSRFAAAGISLSERSGKPIKPSSNSTGRTLITL